MEKIIYLEPDEEVTSIANKIKNAREKTIALVIPDGAVILSSAVNLKLLAEEAKRLGKKVAVVTMDSTGRTVASQLGFTVYENVGDARESKMMRYSEKRDRKPKKPEPEPEEDDEREERKSTLHNYDDLDEDDEDSYNEDEEEDFFEEEAPRYQGKKTQGTFYEKSIHRKSKKSGITNSFIFSAKFWGIAVAGFLLVMFLLVFIFPKATIYLNVYSVEEEVSVPFKVTTDKTNLSSKDNSVILANWEASEKEVTVQVDATGQKNIGDKAKGSVVVYNRSGKSVELRKETEFLTSDTKRFYLLENVIVPGASVSELGEMVPGSITANLEASEGGTGFNIPKSRFYIPLLADSVGNLVFASNEEAFSGGTDKPAKVATKEDIEGGKKKARDEALKKMEEEFGMQGDKIFVKGLGVTENVTEEVDVKEGDPGDKINIKVKAKISFLVFNKSDFDKMFKDTLKLHVSDQKELVGEGYRSVEWEVKKFDDKKKEAEVIGKAKVLVASRLNQDYLKTKFTALNVQELRAELAQYSDVELDKIRFFPPLILTSIPSNERNITIVIQHTEK